MRVADWWSQWRTPTAAEPFTAREESGQHTCRVLTSFGITVVLLLFITLVIPTLIGLILNF